MRFLLDFEGFSVDPITVGPNRWASNDHAGIWCVSWGVKAPGAAIYSGPFITVFNGGVAGAAAVEAELTRRGFQVHSRGDFFAAFRLATTYVAHNAPFEMGVLRWILGIETEPEQWSCTMARSTRLGLPASLEGVLEALRAPVQKDMVGNRLSKKMGKPRGFDVNGAPLWHDDFASVVRCSEYCVSDFAGEAWLDETIPELELREKERFDRQTRENNRGIAVDWSLVSNGLATVRATTEWVNALLPSWTAGALSSITEPSKILAWVNRRGVHIASLEAETLDLTLDATPNLPEDVRRVLEARRSIRTSTMKLEALSARRMPAKAGSIADRVCDLTQYGGARTLRTVGRGFQPLNLPRPGDVDVEAGLAALKAMDFNGMCAAVNKEARERQPSDKAGVRTYRPPAQWVMPSEVVAACLRATLIPTLGRKFVAVDYSGVESRATLTMAGQQDAIEMLIKAIDLYCDLAEQIYGYKVTKKDNPEERQLGKQGILGCGFGMSNPKTFVETCRGYGIYISEEMAKTVIDAYSRRFPRVPMLWRALHRAAKDAMRYPGTWQGDDAYGVKYCYIAEGVGGLAWLQCWLPSGRMMYYPGARLVSGEYGPAIQVMSWKNGRWIPQMLTRQVTVENVIQAICRDMMEEDKEDILKSGRCDIVLTIYDEIVGEFLIDECKVMVEVGEKKKPTPEPQVWMEGMMSRVVPWFPVMPRGVEGHTMTEYGK